MINFTNIDSWHFVTELDVIEITSNADVTFTIKDASNNTILSGIYTPVDGKVRVYHLVKLLQPLITGITAVFSITALSTTKSVHVVTCATLINEGAATFLPSFFLSSVMSERDTSLDRKELLTLIPVEQSLPTVSAVCSYWDGDEVVTDTKSITTTGMTANTPYEIEVSASIFEDNTKGELIAYTITAGDRSMKYRVTTLPKCTSAMVLRNNFGAWDILYLAGSTENNPEYTRETALINGQYSIYNMEETASYKSFTGPLRPSGVAVGYDLARSTNVWLLNKDGQRAVVITAVDVKYTNEDDDIPDFQFTWRPASMISASFDTVRPPQVFDETFDDTYE